MEIKNLGPMKTHNSGVWDNPKRVDGNFVKKKVDREV